MDCGAKIATGGGENVVVTNPSANTSDLPISRDGIIRRSLGMILRHEGYEFLEAASGAEGIQKAQTESPISGGK